MSQTELATLSGVSQAVVSGIERGSVQASMEQEEALATALGVPPALLRQESVAPRVIAPFQRSLPARARNNILANLALSHFHVEQLMGHAAFELPYRERPSDPSRIASLVRLRWGIDDGPIPDMVEMLERRGVVCLVRDTQPVRHGVVGSWPQGARPIVFIGPHELRRSRRWSLAVELGFALTQSDQRTAEMFAAELLMPRREVGWESRGMLGLTHHGPTDLLRVRDLEVDWGVPGSMVVKHAWKVGAITATRYRSLNSAVLATKSGSPDSRGERPGALARAIKALESAGRSRDEIARDALLDPSVLRTQYLADSRS